MDFTLKYMDLTKPWCLNYYQEGTKPIKQTARNFQPELEVQLKEESQKLLGVSFIRRIQHPIWLILLEEKLSS